MPMRNSPSTVSSSSTIRRANGPGRSSNYRRGSNSSSGACSDGSERTARAAFAVRTSRSRARNGKSTFLAAIFIVLFALDCGQAAEVYSRGYQERPGPHYLQRSQANGSQLAELRGFVQSYRSSLHMPSSDSNFESLSRDEKSLDKLNIHAAGVDELHAHPTHAVWEVIDTASGARTQPLIAAITTAGFNSEGICYEFATTALTVSTGHRHRGRAWFAFIAALKMTRMTGRTKRCGSRRIRTGAFPASSMTCTTAFEIYESTTSAAKSFSSFLPNVGVYPRPHQHASFDHHVRQPFPRLR